MRRLRFTGRLVVSGLRWAKELADHVLLMLGVLLLVAGIAVGGVLLHRPAWFLGVGGGVLAVLILGEGAYRTWDEADRRADTMEARAATGEGVGLEVWLGKRSQDMRALAERLREQIAPGAVMNIWRCEAIESAFWQLSRDVLARLHIGAPEWADYYMQNPDWYKLNGVTAIRPEEFEERAKLFDYTVDQIEHIRTRL